MSISQRLRAAAAVLVTAAAAGLLTLGSPQPATAAACSGTSGVTVVVEPGGLGGGTQVDCAPDGGGRTAAQLLEDVGHSLTYVQRFPGFVCRIDGAPADDPCVNTPPADAYWGLWWSDGKSGRWTYSSLGARSLNIPAGGYVALVWDGTTSTVRPQTPAPAHATPSPTPSPTTKPPTSSPTPQADPTSTPSSDGPTPGTPTPSASTTKKPKPSKTPAASESTTSSQATPEASDDHQTEAAAPVDQPVDNLSEGDGGLPAWVAPVVVVLLLGGAGGVAVARRRARP
jgi:hypothetical protein